MPKEGDISSGFLIVKTFEQMHTEYPFSQDTGYTPYYSMPVPGLGPEHVIKRYRGISRDPLESWSREDLERGFPGIPAPTEPAACLALDELERVALSDNSFIFSADAARHVFKLLQHPHLWELIWTCKADYDQPRPTGTSLLGYEPTWWTGDHFSAVMDSMCFPRWHGPDPEGVQLTKFHDLLNEAALFPTSENAAEFLHFYVAQPWAETGPYEIAEVRFVHDVG